MDSPSSPVSLILCFFFLIAKIFSLLKMDSPSSPDILEQSYERQNERLQKLQEVANKAVNTLFSCLAFYIAIFSISAYWFHIELRCNFFPLVVAMTSAYFLSVATHFNRYYQEISQISNEVACVKLKLEELERELEDNIKRLDFPEKIKLVNLRKRVECLAQASKRFFLEYYLILLAAIVASLIFASSFQFGVYQVLCVKKKWN